MSENSYQRSKRRNAFAALLNSGPFQPKRVEPKTGHRRRPKHIQSSDLRKENWV